MPKLSPRVLWVSLALVLLLAATAFLVVSSRIHAFLRSEDFRRLVSEKTGDAFRAEAEVTPMRWAGSSVFSDSLRATGNPGSIVQDVRADQVRAAVNWRAIFDGAWRVDEVEVLNFSGTFRPGSPEAGRDGGDPPVAASGLAAWLPSRFELGRLRVSQAHIAFQRPDGAPPLTLDGTAVEVRPDGAGWAITGSGGDLMLPGLPEMAVTGYRTRIQGDTFFLTDASLRLGESGKISGSGEFSRSSRLRVQWDQVDLQPFLNPDWQKRFSGLMSGTAEMAWPESGVGVGDARVTGSFLVTDGLVQNVATLEEVARFTGAPQFRRMPVQQLSADYTWSRDDLVLTNLVLESKGLLRVEGTCSIGADRTIDGKLRVGVTAQSLQWLPGSRERVFTVAQNGYLWTDVRLGGTLDRVHEDLTARLTNAAADQVIQSGVQAIESLPNATKGGVNQVIDLLSPLVR